MTTALSMRNALERAIRNRSRLTVIFKEDGFEGLERLLSMSKVPRLIELEPIRLDTDMRIIVHRKDWLGSNRQVHVTPIAFDSVWVDHFVQLVIPHCENVYTK